jgi:hypothetical protein
LENALYCPAGSIYILKKIQNGVVLVKKQKKSQRVATGFCRVTGSTCRVGRVMTFSIFSSIRSGFTSWSAGFRVDPPGQTGFQNYETSRDGLSTFLSSSYLFFHLFIF